jgi:hypothetical protein
MALPRIDGNDLVARLARAAQKAVAPPPAAKAPAPAMKKESEFSTGAGRALRDFSASGSLPSSGKTVSLEKAVRPDDGGSPPDERQIQAATDDLKNALATRKTAYSTGNFHAEEAADEDVSGAQARLKQAIKSSGQALQDVNMNYAYSQKDPAERIMVAEAAADLAGDQADAVAAKYGLQGDSNLEGRAPDGEHMTDAEKKKVSVASANATRDARELQGRMIDQLNQVADRSVADVRATGVSQADALKQLQPAAAGKTGQDVLFEKSGVPNTLGMTDAEKHDLYEKKFLATASKDAIAAYNSGQRVVLALRHDTSLSENGGKGEFDDRFVVLQKSPQVAHEYRACLDPNTQYGNGMRSTYNQTSSSVGPYASSDGNGKAEAYGRIAGGQTIRFQTGPDNKLYPPPNGGYRTQGDGNGDGDLNDNDYRTEDSNGFQLHGSAVGHTGSGGCITVPFYMWNDFKADATQGNSTVSVKNSPTWWPWSGSHNETTLYVAMA